MHDRAAMCRATQACASTAISAFCRRNVLLPPCACEIGLTRTSPYHVGACQNPVPVVSKVAVVGHKLSWSGVTSPVPQLPVTDRSAVHR